MYALIVWTVISSGSTMSTHTDTWGFSSEEACEVARKKVPAGSSIIVPSARPGVPDFHYGRLEK